MEEIDLKRLTKTAYTLKLYLVIIMVFFICVGIVYSFAYNKPKYKSYTKIALTQVSNENDLDSTNSITQTDITMNKNLLDTYTEVIKSKKVLREVIQNLALDVDHEELAKMISTSTADNSTILKIEVSSLTSQFSKDVANEIAKVFSKQVKEIYNISNVNILDEAEKAEEPYNINHVKDMLIFTVIGIFASVGVVLIVYMLDTTIKQEEDIEESAQLPSLGTIPLLEKDDITSKTKNRREKRAEKRLNGVDMPTTEAFRTLRTNLTFAQKNQKIKNILVTSSYSGEGKSYVSSNLAVALARSNKKILIIDADMRKGRQNTIFKVGNSKGLSNFLSETKVVNAETVSRYIKTTSIPDVHIITSGDRPTNPSELLSSRKMIELLQVLDEIYDMVIIDGTPSILVSDSVAIAKFVDNVIIVVAHKVTKIDNLLKVKKLLENVGAKITGVVLNKYPMEESSYKEKYYYSDQKTGVLEENDKDKRIRTVKELIDEAEKNKEKVDISSFEIENNVNITNKPVENAPMAVTTSENEALSDVNFMQYKMENISNEISNIKNLFIQYVMNNKTISVTEFNELKIEIENIKEMIDKNSSVDINKELREELSNIKEVTTELTKQQAYNREKVKDFIEAYRKKLS